MKEKYALFLDADGTIFSNNSWEVMLDVVGFKRDNSWIKKFEETPKKDLETLLTDWTKHDVYQIYSRKKEGDTDRAMNSLRFKPGFLEFMEKYQDKFSHIEIVSSGFDKIIEKIAKAHEMAYSGLKYQLHVNPPRNEGDISVIRVMVSKNKRVVMDKHQNKNRIYIADDPTKNYEGNHNGILRIYMDGEAHQTPTVNNFYEAGKVLDIVFANNFDEILKHPETYFSQKLV